MALNASATLVQTMMRMTHYFYVAGALALGAWYAVAAVRVYNRRTVLQARGVLFASIAYLPLLYSLMLLDPAG
jgi:heme O synthase-like polyprenyltransferase